MHTMNFCEGIRILSFRFFYHCILLQNENENEIRYFSQHFVFSFLYHDVMLFHPLFEILKLTD